MHRRLGVVGILVAALGLALPAGASALRLKRVATGFDSPVHVTSNRRDRGGTLYVVEQPGRVWRLRSGRKTLFLDIRGLVSFGGERGLLSLAFSPRYGKNRHFFVNYTDNGGDVRVARFRANRTFSRGVRRSRRMLLDVEHSTFSNHNGGLLAFGPNGRLYVSVGDGGGGCDPGENAQDLSSRKGKLLSTDVDNLPARWRRDGYGLRNPWRFSFDRANGRLYVADVGQTRWEEISTLRRGRLGGTPENFMWDRYEGRRVSSCSSNGLRGPGRRVRPIDVYGHSLGCSVTGGHVYRGRRLQARLRGWYFFGDYCSGRIWRLKFAHGRVVGKGRLVRDTALNISSFGEGKNGHLFVADHGGGIYRFARG
ncbi:MAG: PQQ-dependent sugar dehydrogenase [Gaiellaceae bacterium]